MLKEKIPNPRDIAILEAVEELRTDVGVVPGERVVSFRTFMSLSGTRGNSGECGDWGGAGGLSHGVESGVLLGFYEGHAGVNSISIN